MYWQSLWPKPCDWNPVAGFSSNRSPSKAEEIQPMPIASKTAEQAGSAAEKRERRAREAAQAMRDYQANRVATLAKTERLRAIRLAKEAANSAPEHKMTNEA
jgi:hypothetical protein